MMGEVNSFLRTLRARVLLEPTVELLICGTAPYYYTEAALSSSTNPVSQCALLGDQVPSHHIPFPPFPHPGYLRRVDSDRLCVSCWFGKVARLLFLER